MNMKILIYITLLILPLNTYASINIEFIEFTLALEEVGIFTSEEAFDIIASELWLFNK